MRIVRHEPSNLINRLQSEINDFFSMNGHAYPGDLFNEPDITLLDMDWKPVVDIHEEKDAFIVTADLPGVETKDTQISMDKGMLSIKGERKSEKKEEKANYKLKEINYGKFERRFLMPDTADADKITAERKNGILTITIEKKPASEPKLISIKE